MGFKKSAVVTSAVAAGLVWLVGCCCKNIPVCTPTAPGGGDEPVVMAGGSMRFITPAHRFDVDPTDNHKLSHDQKARRMTQVDILYSVSDLPAVAMVPLNNLQNTIEIDYCSGSVQNGNCSGTKETVKVQSDNAGKGMDIIAPKVMSNPSSNVVDYPPPEGNISQIRINNGSYNCPSQRKGYYCFLVIHYK